MKNKLYILGIVVLFILLFFIYEKSDSNHIGEDDLEYKIEELTEEISYLEEENNSLECQLEEKDNELENAKDYIEELQQLLEENGIDEWEGIDFYLTDENGNPVIPNNDTKTIPKITKDKNE